MLVRVTDPVWSDTYMTSQISNARGKDATFVALLFRANIATSRHADVIENKLQGFHHCFS